MAGPKFLHAAAACPTLARTGERPAGSSEVRRADASYPENEEVWKGLVPGLQKSGSYDQALEAVRRIPTAVASVT